MASDQGSSSLHGPTAATDAEAQQLALSEPKIRKIYDYWSGKRRGDALPARRDIDPVDVHDCLSALMILDVVDGGRDFRIRLAGSQIEEAHDRSLMGLLVGDIGEGEELAVMLERFRAIVGTRLPDFRSVSLSMVGRAFIEFDRVALPLAEDGQTVSHILCCYVQRQREAQVRPRSSGAP